MINNKLYSYIKNIILKIIPKKSLLKNEFLIRKVYSLLFIGKKVYCNLCEKSYSKFINIHGNDNLCPGCGSLARHRRLWQIINNDPAINKNSNILDFSPSRIFAKKMKKKYPGYVSSDYIKNPLVDRNYDITDINAPENSFDIIICYHILEHIENDIKAIKELYRILEKGGKIFIQTPFKDGEIYENPQIRDEKGRLEHFGQEDHVRIYSAIGLKSRLENAGFYVSILSFNENELNINRFSSHENLLIAAKKQYQN